MIIQNFGDLKTELTRYLMHARFSADYDLATKHFENEANRRLRVRPMEARVNLTTINGECALPPDFVSQRCVIWSTNPDDELDYVHPLYLNTLNRNRRLYTIEGNKFRTNPVDDTTDRYDFHYYTKIPTITGSTTASNWLLADHSDVYLEGALMELFLLQRNLELAAPHKTRRDDMFGSIIQLYALSTLPTSPAVRSDAEYF